MKAKNVKSTVPRKEEKELSPNLPFNTIITNSNPQINHNVSSKLTTKFTPQINSQNPKHTFTNQISIISPSTSPHTNNKPLPIRSLPKSNAHPSSLPNYSLRRISNNHNINGTKRPKPVSNGLVNHQNTAFNINFIPSQQPLIKSSEHMTELMTRFGRPQTMADFNIMAIAGVLSEGNHIHKNRELKASVKRFTEQIQSHYKEIKELKTSVKVYKTEAEKYERLLIKYNEVKDLNGNLLEHNAESKKETAKLKKRIKEQRDEIEQGLMHGINDNLTPLAVDDNNDTQSKDDILAHNGDKIETDGDNMIANDVRQPSEWVKNQRLIQLTGDQTYMSAHQKVIRDPDQKKSHQSYQRKETFKGLQNENQSLKQQIVTLTQELQDAKSNHASVSEDGVSADYLKGQLAKVREELEEEKRITATCTSIVDSSDDLETTKIKLSKIHSEYERLKMRYEASKQRVENLAEEKEEEKILKDKAIKQRDNVKAQTKALLKGAKDNIVNVSNEKEALRKEMHRLQRANKKLMERESEEEELKEQIKKLEKKAKDGERQLTKYKKKYKDTKFELDTMSGDKKHKKRKKTSVYMSSDCSEKEKISKTVKLMKKWDKTDKKKKKKKKRKEKDILNDLESAIHQTKHIGNHFKINDDDDINWSDDDDDDEDELIVSNPFSNNSNHNTMNAAPSVGDDIDDMSFGSMSPNMMPMDTLFDTNTNVQLKNESNRMNVDTMDYTKGLTLSLDPKDDTADNNMNNTNNIDIIEPHDGDDEGQSEDEFIDHDLVTANDVFKTESRQNMHTVPLQSFNNHTEDDGISSGILTGITSPLQNPVSRGLSVMNPFTKNTNTVSLNDNNNDKITAPLMIQKQDVRKEQTQQNVNIKNGRNGIKPQPLFGGFEGGISDSSDADHSDHVHFESPVIQAEPHVFAPLKIDGDDDIHANAHLFNDNIKNDVLKLEQLSDDDHPISNDINHKKRARNNDGMNINEPLNKKRKLNNDNDDFDFETFMDEDDESAINNSNINIDNEVPKAPPMSASLLMTSPVKPPININPFETNMNEEMATNVNAPDLKPPMNINPFETNNNNNMNETDTNTDNVSIKHNTDDHIKENTKNIDSISAEYINTQFIDWKTEFIYLVTHSSDKSLINSCTHSIICRWNYPNNECDAQNTLKDITMGILDIMVMSSFNDICFDFNNKSSYLSLFSNVCDILCKLNRFNHKKKQNLISEIKKKCKKILNKQLFKSLSFGAEYYFVCGLLSILCESFGDEGFFWRSIFFVITIFELHECAVLFSIMFGCFPSQISSHRDSFVINCFRHIFLFHSNSILNIKNSDIKHCYIGLNNVINGEWNYILSRNRDNMLKEQINKSIESRIELDETEKGVLMLCECDIRYSVNHFLPNILYPIIYQQFNNHKPKIHVFLLDLYFESVNRIYKRLKTKCFDGEISCDLVRNDIEMIMDSILTLSIGCCRSALCCIEPMVALCCIRNLLQIKPNDYIQSTIFHNVNSDHQLLQFATNIFRAWNQRINNKLSSLIEKKRERDKFNALMHIISNVFKKKCYNIEAYLSLKKQYNN